MNGRYYLGDFESRAFAYTLESVRLLKRQGLRQEHGIGPNLPLSASELRDLDTIDRAIRRLIARDQKRRGG